jgi:hypothetical protein
MSINKYTHTFSELYQSVKPGPEANEMTTATQLRDALLAVDPLKKVSQFY